MRRSFIIVSIVFAFIFLLGLAFETNAASNEKKTPIVSIKKKILNSRLFVEANLAKNTGNYKQAELLYLRCLKQDPNDAAAMYELATIYLAAEKADLALEYVKRAVEIDTENSYYKSLLSNIYIAKKNYKESLNILSDLASQNPDKSEYIRQLAYIYVMAQDYENAIKVLEQLEAKIGVNETISLQKQQLYLSLDQPNKAITEVEKLVEEYPFETRFYSILAELYNRNGSDEKALWAYNKIIEIDPGDEYIHISLYDYYNSRDQKEKAYEQLYLAFKNPELNIETKFQLLFTFYTTDQIYTTESKNARELVWLIESIHPSNTRVKGLQADLLYRSNELEEAKAILEKVIAAGNNEYPWYELLLIIESDLRNIDRMTELGEKVVSLYSDKPLPYLLAGLGKYQQNKYVEAEAYFSMGLKFAGENPPLLAQFYSSLGDVYHQLDRISASDEAYEKALEIDSANSIVLNNYAYYLAIRGEKLERAEQMSKLATELDPGNSSNIDTRAWVLYKMGKYQEALVFIKEAFEIDNKNPELNEHYGDILFKIGDTKKAVKYWKRAKSFGGGSEFLDQKIKTKKLIE